MAVNPKEKELTAVGISVAAGCKPCTNYHVKEACQTGASDEEMKRAAVAALDVREGATGIMRFHVLARLGEGGDGGDPGGDSGGAGETDRIKVLVSVGAAFAVNCTSSLKKHLAAAESLGISPDDIAEIVELAAFIKGMAVHHAERAAGITPEKAA